MNRERASRAYDLIAEGFAELAIAIREIEQPGAGGASPAAAPASGSPVPADPAPLRPELDAGLGICPIHGVAWTVAPAGISKRTGEKYDAFFKCAEKTGDEWCKQKPQKIWRDTHPIREAA